MPKQVDLTTGKEVPLDPKVVKIIQDEPTTMREFAKFAIGKKVKIKDRIHGHEFKIGEVVEIEFFHKNAETLPWLCKSKEGERWWIDEDEATVCGIAETIETSNPPQGYSKEQLVELVRYVSAELLARYLSLEDSESILDDFLETQEPPNK